MKLTNILAATVAALVAGGIFAAPALDRAENVSLDSLMWLRHGVFGQRHVPADSPSAVIAVDEETYRTEPFRDLPKVMWTKQFGAVLDGVREAGAAVIGFDIILPTSVEPFIRGHDRDFMLALRRAAGDNKIVLAKVQHQVKPIAPFAGHSFAVGHQRNIRAVNFLVDADGITRSVPLFFTAENSDGTLRRDSSFALELAARAAGEAPRIDPENGDVWLGNYRIPGGRDNALDINFDGGASIPTYSLADIHACVAAGEEDFLRQHFAGKVVLFGVVLDVKDRMVERGEAPERGGESRELTVLFSDIENFITVSEHLTPEQLVGGLNIYLSEMTDIIERHGGFVDKYIGDAIVAVFGAPLEDAEHARHAVTAALACSQRLAQMPGVFAGHEDLILNARIGLNSGEMLVGNIGSKRRFNYTVMGDAVNLAARLEGASKVFGSSILVSESTARACGEAIAMRELDLIRVVGREAPLAVYEPLCLATEADAAVTEKIAAYAGALARYRMRDFEAAAAALEAMGAA
ncbi:MAG: adenylate/guanylate cyclase domain-containing protein, partial [Alphaproteobacteria bacterium]|nr:adenylate/guanylate cyclase domain-containing protein [Alphaproteobacteria bacterium]